MGRLGAPLMRESVTGTEGRWDAQRGATGPCSCPQRPWTPYRTPAGRFQPLRTRLGGWQACPAT
jgi:hypothetical protein